MATDKDNAHPQPGPAEDLSHAKHFHSRDPGDRHRDHFPRRMDVRLLQQHPMDVEHAELNSVIRYQQLAIGFEAYKKYMDRLVLQLDRSPGGLAGMARRALRENARSLENEPDSDTGPGIKLHGTLAYEVLRLATEAFLLTRCGPYCADFRDVPSEGELDDFLEKEERRVRTPDYAERVREYLLEFITSDSGAATPYLDTIIGQLDDEINVGNPLTRLYASRWQCPLMIELIWSYWHEEGMLSQAMNAIAIRFQNRRSRPGNDPLASLEIDPLRPLNNLLWGWIQSEYRRLSVQRRAYEYDHHYGMTLLGKAVPPLLSADSRSKFLEAFHQLLWEAHDYYEQSANTTIVPQGFPLVNALRNLHLILAEGAHNQYGDLPWTSRVEMLIEQWLLARPEMRAFLRGRIMVPYMEPWMGQVDTMKKLQGWTDVTVTHFHDLAVCGEALLLSVRHGPWANQAVTDGTATAWAAYWRNEVQRYIYSYKAVTGIDLTLKPQDNTMPARLMTQRLVRQQQSATHR